MRFVLRLHETFGQKPRELLCTFSCIYTSFFWRSLRTFCLLTRDFYVTYMRLLTKFHEDFVSQLWLTHETFLVIIADFFLVYTRLLVKSLMVFAVTTEEGFDKIPFRHLSIYNQGGLMVCTRLAFLVGLRIGVSSPAAMYFAKPAGRVVPSLNSLGSL